MESEIDRYKHIQKEQEMKLNLFKKTISTLQLQLQEKSTHISRLENTNNQPVTNNNDDKIDKLLLQLNQREDIIISLEKEIENDKNDFEQMKKNLQQHLNDKQNLSNKYLEMRQTYQVLDNNYQKKEQELKENVETLSNIQKELTLEKTLKENLQKELDVLKNQMSEYIKDIKNITIEKDNEILNLNLIIQRIKEEENKNIQNNDNKLDQTIRERVIGRARGINANLKRGVRTSTGSGIRPS